VCRRKGKTAPKGKLPWNTTESLQKKDSEEKRGMVVHMGRPGRNSTPKRKEKKIPGTKENTGGGGGGGGGGVGVKARQGRALEGMRKRNKRNRVPALRDGPRGHATILSLLLTVEIKSPKVAALRAR